MTDYIKTRKIDRKILITTIFYDLLRKFFVRDLAHHRGRVARTMDRVDPSTPRCWSGGRLGHHGGGVFASSCVLWLVVASLRARRM
jgi:hypothetical protein